MNSTQVDLANPFPGLRPFDMGERNVFFGREAAVAELLDRLSRNRFLAVVGTSGSGKSSLIRAGLLPELYGGALVGAPPNWEILTMRPGVDPVGNLADEIVKSGMCADDDSRLRDRILSSLNRSWLGLVETARQADLSPNTSILLLVDQFEELFRFRTGTAQAKSDATDFVNLLLEAVHQDQLPIYVVLTMRSDFLGECAHFPGLAEAVNTGEYLVPRLKRAELRAAIEGPIRVHNARLTARLTQTLLNEIGDDQDQLPVLQHALMRTWNHWVSRAFGDPMEIGHRGEASESTAVDLADYEAVGGIQGALSRHADEIYDDLPTDAHRHIASALFKSITEQGADNRGIRRPTSIEALSRIIPASVPQIIEVVSAYRRPGRTLLMPMEPTPLDPSTIIDISHESLMRVWEKLAVWVDQEATSAKTYRRLADSAILNQQQKAGYFRGPDLQVALEWKETERPTESWAQRYHPEFRLANEFLNKSAAAAQEEQREREQAQQKELEQAKALARTQSRAAQAFKIFSVAMSVLVLIAVFAFVRAERKATEAERADQQSKQTLSNADFERSQRLLEADKPTEALAYLGRAVRNDPSNTLAATTIFQTLRDTPALLPAERVFPTETDPTLPPGFGSLLQVTTDLDSNRCAFVFSNRPPLFFDLNTAKILESDFAYSGPNLASGFADGGRRYVVVTNSKVLVGEFVGEEVRVTEIPSNQPILDATILGIPPSVLALSLEGGLDAIDLQTGQIRELLPADQELPINGENPFTPYRVAAEASGGQFALWAPGRQQVVIGHPNIPPETWRTIDELTSIQDCRFSPDGKDVLISTFESERPWTLATGTPKYPSIRLEDRNSGYLYAFEPEAIDLLSAASDLREFSPDSSMIAVASSQTILLHSNDSGSRLAPPIPIPTPSSLAFSPSSAYLAIGSWDGSIRLYSSSGDRIDPPLVHDAPVVSIQFLDETQLLAATRTGLFRWDLESGAELMTVGRSERPSPLLRTFLNWTTEGKSRSFGIQRTENSFFQQLAITTIDQEEESAITAPLLGSPPTMALLSEDSEFIIVRYNNRVEVRSVRDLTPHYSARVSRVLNPFDSFPDSGEITLSPNREYIITHEANGRTVFHKWRTKDSLELYEGSPSAGGNVYESRASATFSGDGQTVLVSYDSPLSPMMVIVDTETVEPIVSARELEETLSWVVPTSNSQQFVYSGISDSVTIAWIRNGSLIEQKLDQESFLWPITRTPDQQRMLLEGARTVYELQWNDAPGSGALREVVSSGSDIRLTAVDFEWDLITTVSQAGNLVTSRISSGKALHPEVFHDQTIDRIGYVAPGFLSVQISSEIDPMGLANYRPKIAIWDARRGKQLTPYVDGALGNIADEGRTVRPWDSMEQQPGPLPPYWETVPTWLAEFAEAASGFRLNARDTLEAILLEDRRKALAAPANDPTETSWGDWAQWVATSPHERTQSYWDKTPLSRGLERMIATEDPAVLRELKRVFPFHPLVVDAFATKVSQGWLDKRPGAKVRQLLKDSYRATWSPDGRMAAVGRARGLGIQTLDLLTLELEQINSNGKDPIWNPKRDLIAYVVETSHNRYTTEEVWMSNTDGSDAKRLLNGTYPSWRPEGDALIAYSWESESLVHIDITTDPPTIEPFYEDPGIAYCAVSPDGSLVAMGERGPDGAKLVIRSVDTREKLFEWAPPSPERAAGILPAFSPDGQTVAIGGYNADTIGIWMFHLPEFTPERVIKGRYTGPVWSWDQRRFSFDHRPSDTDGLEIWVIELDPNTP